MSSLKKAVNLLFSTRFTAILIVVFSVAMAVATFIENDFGTPAARKLVFDASWFETVMVLLAINFIGNIKKYKMWKRESWPTLLFHSALIVIIIGAAISRLISFEGIMHIREGDRSSVIISDKTYLQVEVNDESYYEKELLLTPITNNEFNWDVPLDEHELEIGFVHYIPRAIEVYREAENGYAVLHLVVTDNASGRTDIFIPRGEIKNVMGTIVSFDQVGDADIKILSGEDGQFFMIPHHDVQLMRMDDQSRDVAKGDSMNTFERRALYMHDGLSFVFKDFMPSATQQIITSDEERHKNRDDAVVVSLTYNGQSSDVVVRGKKGALSQPEYVEVNGNKVAIRYGSKTLKTPFAIELDDFQLERYPGSMSPASFASEVKVIDGKESFPFRIFMNHVLDYKGYRFFQASYDTDEQGTVLSVNHDRLGTMVTYIGYTLMILGMMIAPFWRGSRFSKVVKALSSKSAISLAFILFSTAAVHADHTDSLLQARAIPEEHADKFAQLVVQDEGGRLKPLGTVASEVVRKLQGKNEYAGMSAHQVFLGLHADPAVWSAVPLIKIKKGKHDIESITGLKGKNARYLDFFDEEGNFLLAEQTDDISKKQEKDRSEQDKLILEISQRVTLMYEVFNGKHMRIFPMADHPDNKWYSHTDFGVGFTGQDSVFVYHMLPYYFNEVRQGIATNDWASAEETLDYFFKFQEHYGNEVMPSKQKVDLEIMYNKSEVFNKLYQYYGLIGFIMLILLIMHLLRERRWIKVLIPVFSGLIILMFLAHTAGLGIRWYISGHAPWSNAYESMVYVAWATVLAGLLFIRRSKITLAATAVMASVFLMVAHWNWMNPEIGNLVPVLNSYWLMIHVAIIVASYGPFTLNFLLGIIALVLIIFKSKNKPQVEAQIARLTNINELIMTIGVFLLAIGTFLGGVWANESWGRYWSWDPKETWALISVMVYSFVLHMRLIPGLRGKVAFNIASTFAYASIMMTYFGVNFYLAGMHSYAKGDPVPVPNFVYYTVFSLIALSAIAYFRDKRK